jgi:hypothetical protein
MILPSPGRRLITANHFFEQLVLQLVQSKQIDNDIILLGDFNEHIYSGCLSQRLAMVDLSFVELCWKHTGKPVSPTHCSGSAPIDGIFATSGMDCVNAFILPHYGGIGDHRCFIMDISLDSMIGTSFQNIVRCAAQKLHCSSTRMIKVYNAELTRLCNKHNMFHWMDVIYCLTDYLENNDFALLMDAWDNKFMQLMLHSETECSKFMIGHIEWSPIIGVWLSRQ